ncbi:MAG TPA: hypothetical protein ENK06_13380, partial [Gammaproteobacteria bacterium]|nr:hypothetical protein [Gammaproteobacteria bacterium]
MLSVKMRTAMAEPGVGWNHRQGHRKPKNNSSDVRKMTVEAQQKIHNSKKTTIAKMACQLLVALVLLFVAFGPAYAATITWDGGGSDNNWNTCANWDTGDTCPGASDVATFNATSTKNATINVDPNVAGIDIQAGYTGTISQSAGVTVTVGTSGLIQAAGTFTGSNALIDINGKLTMSGGTFTATSGVTEISRDYTYTGGTITPNGGTFKFAHPGSSGSTITGTHTLNNISFDTGSGSAKTWNIAAGTVLTASGTLSLDSSGSGGIYLSGSGEIAAQGDIVLDELSYAGSSTLRINGTGNQSLTGSGGTLPSNVIISKNSGILSLIGSFRVRNWTYANTGSGTLNAGTSAITFTSADAGATLTGSHTLYDVTLGHDSSSSRTWTIADGTTLTTTGTLAFNNSDDGSSGGYSAINSSGSGKFSAQGNVTVSSAGGGPFLGSATLEFSGNATQSFDLTGYEGHFNLDINVNKSGGQINLLSNLTMDAAGQDLDIIAGTLDLNGKQLT